MPIEDVNYRLSLTDLFTPKIKSATTATEKLNNAVSGIGSKLGSIGGALGIGLGAAGLVQFGVGVKDALVNYEYFSASLRTLMLGDKNAAKALEGQLVELAKTTPFSLVEVQDATKQLVGYGFAAGTVTTNIRMLGDVASGLKIPFGDMAYLFGTLKSQGRAYTKDLNEFANRGIPIYEELGKVLKVSSGDVRKFASDGKIGFYEVEKAFKNMTSEGGMFFNMLDTQAKTTGGQISNLGDSWEQLQVEIGKSQTGIINGTVSFLNDTTSALANWFKTGSIMHENFNNNEAYQFNIWQKLAHETLGAVSAYRVGYQPILEQEEFQKEIYDKFVNKKATKGSEAQAKLVELYQKLSNLGGQTSRGVYTQDQYMRYASTLKGAITSVKGEIGLLAKVGVATHPPGVDTEDKKYKSTTIKSGTSLASVEARQANNFNITIEKFGEMTNNFETVNESTASIKTNLTKSLIAAINDFQIMATK